MYVCVCLYVFMYMFVHLDVCACLCEGFIGHWFPNRFYNFVSTQSLVNGFNSTELGNVITHWESIIAHINTEWKLLQ